MFFRNIDTFSPDYTTLHLRRQRLLVRVPDEVDFSIYLILPVALWPWGSTQPLTVMSTRNLPGGKKRPARRADNLAAICEPNI
jgi:hypothetical protein